ncbi:MAG TPA: hypothetical protein VE287_00315 [Actinopolymorphaceae bacterium]|nr:hypothetical protein [Actinopolymorphaceae bacterium]
MSMPATERPRGSSAGRDAVRWVFSRASRVTILLAGLLAVAVLVVEVAYRRPPSPTPALPRLLRTGLSMPTWLAQIPFGHSQAAYLVVPMLAGVALAVGVFLIGALVLSRAAGLAAAAMTIGNSIVFPALTRPSAEVLATALLCWALVLTVALRQRRVLVAATRRRQLVVLLAVGVLLGWSYLTYEWAVLGWLLVPLLLRRRMPAADLIWVGVPALLIVTGETIYATVAYGDPLVRLHAVLSSHPAVEGLGLPPASSSPIAILAAMPEGLWLDAVLVAAVVGALASRRLGFLLVWAASFALPMLALSVVLDPGTPLRHVQDGSQWIPLVPAVALGATGALWLLMRKGVLRAVPTGAGLTAAVVTVAVVAVPVGIAQHARASGRTPADHAYAANGGRQLEDFRDWLVQHAGGVGAVWADRTSIETVRMFTIGTFGGTVWHGDLRAWLAGAGHPQPVPGDYVVLYSPRSDVCPPCREAAQALLGAQVNVPKAWQPAYRGADGGLEVYQVR